MLDIETAGHFKIRSIRSIRTARTSDILDQGLEKAKKKRKRLLKKFNRTHTQKLLKKISQLNETIKNKIITSRKQQLNIKVQGNNVKSFWNAVSTLEGKKVKEDIKLNLNGQITDDPKVLVEEFADFFASKVNTLSNNYGKLDYSIGNSSLNITIAEIVAATKRIKNKLCTGEDDIPMKIAKDIVLGHLDLFRQFFNDCSSKGLPERWKTAIIVPLFKSGDKEKVSQYRPISNLDSLSKIYERIVLQRLNSLDQMDGQFQHGFKENRSTVTAALELQDFVASKMDSGHVVGTYSLDLSAAFDLLRPDIFLETMRNLLPLNLLQTLMDFLSNRQFRVQIGKTRSSSKRLLVGCVQGSILGPRLFTLYMRKLGDIFKDAHLVSFADDSYVSIARPRVDEVRTALEETMTVHDTFLRSIGMVTNVEKTELILFSRKPIADTLVITVNGKEIKAKKSIKVLGITFDSNLGWASHLEKIKQKARFVLHKMKFLRRYLTMEEMKKVITSHFYGMIYYGAPVWMTETSLSSTWNLLNVLHYKALRTVCADYNRKKSRRLLDSLVKRARPHEWMKFINVKTAIQLTLLGESGPPLSRKLRDNLYRNDRTGKISFMDTSRLKIGKRSLQNRLKTVQEFQINWLDGISKDRLRIELKKSFIKI